jgi:hypothetical protein
LDLCSSVLEAAGAGAAAAFFSAVLCKWVSDQVTLEGTRGTLDIMALMDEAAGLGAGFGGGGKGALLLFVAALFCKVKMLQ